LSAELEHFPKFITAFDRLSKARRGLGGLDTPVAADLNVKITAITADSSVDDEIRKLELELGMNDPPPAPSAPPEPVDHESGPEGPPV
jgi:hypothetical protein